MPTISRPTGRTFCPRSIGGRFSNPAGLPRLIPARNRIPPIAPERAAAHPHSRRCLSSLVLVALHQIQNTPHRGPVESARRDLIDRQILFDEGLENRVENFI